MEDLQSMKIKELKELRKQWYQQAQQNGSLNRCYKVCTIRGKRISHRYGPKYLFFDDEHNLELYVDAYGNYFTATWKGKLVMSTHPCTQLFIPGDWMDIVNHFFPSAEKKAQQEEERQEKIERQNLIDELSFK